jgi:uncharacterized protein YbjQ (UPF0145 family)
VTTESVAGREIVRVIGLVRGSTVRGADVGTDLKAWMKNLVGGEIPEYTKLLAESREQAIDRMLAQAHERGANAVVGVRFINDDLGHHCAEILAYGTAVVLE